MSEKKIILASGSPRRRELLTQIGISFTVRVSQVEERATATVPRQLVQELSACKAKAVFEGLLEEERKESMVIGADTVVAVDDLILGKPKDQDDARRMLQMLQGRSHEVYTGVTLLSGDQSKQFYEKTVVSMFPMTEEEITSYIESQEPMDKAGSYGIQGLCAKYIQGISGDYNNVVGLPIGRLYQEMKSFQ